MKHYRLLKRVSVYLLTCLFFSASVRSSFSFVEFRGSEECAKTLAKAEGYYGEGFFEQAIKIILGSGFEQDCTEREKALVYKLLAKLYLAKNYSERARFAVEKMVASDPGIVLDPAKEPPPLLSIYAEVKKTHRKEEKPLAVNGRREEDKRRSKILPLVLGGVAGSVVALLALSGGNQQGPVIQDRGFPRPVGRPGDDD